MPNGLASLPMAAAPQAMMDSKMPAVANSVPPSNASSSNNDDYFTNAVERILSALESRSDEHLTAKDLSDLSMLCTLQYNNRNQGLNVDLGFADVDPSLTGQLVEALQKHVALATTVDFVQEGYQVIHQVADGAVHSIEAWLQSPQCKLLEQKLLMGLEAAAILLFVINSPGIDRTVVNEDAIEASIVLFRHHLSKNILPALNQVGHITSAAKSKGGASPGPSSSKTPSTSAKKRRRSSGAAASEGGDATTIRDMKKVYKPMYKTIGPLVQIMERLETLVQKTPLDDQPLLNVSSGALMSLELDPMVQADFKKALSIHEAAIGVVTAIFRKYPRHRQTIVEDLFPLMLKIPSFKKSMRNYPVQSSSVLFPTGLQILSQSLAAVDPGAIQTITAVILSLVQSSVVPPQVEGGAPDVEHDDGDGSAEPSVAAPLHIVSGLKGCQSVCDLFVAHLLGRCSKKGEDGGASEFRPILQNLIDDLLVVLLVPEYPAAEMLLMSITNRISMELVAICNNNSNAETTFLNTILDAFGKICAAEARILKYHREKPVCIRNPAITDDPTAEQCYCGRQGGEHGAAVECSRCHTKYHSLCVAMIQDTMPERWYCDACQLGRIVDFERERNTNLGDLGCSPELVDESYCMRRLLIDYLSIVSRKSGVTGFQDAYEFHLARWLSELDQVHNKGSSSPVTNVWPLVARLKELWDPRESSELSNHNILGQNSLNGMLHCLSDEGRSRIMVHLVATQSQLLVTHRSQITLFVNQLIENRSSVLLRRLALKAIEKVTDADPKLMIYPFVRNAVAKRFSDEAISVREAAVSLVGLYVVHSPAVANDFHQAFMIGLQDPGVSVRKRTIRILQDILCAHPSYKGRAEACTVMLRLAADPKEDDSVRDAIHDLFLKVWLENGDEKIEQDVVQSPVSNVQHEIDTRPRTPGSRVMEVDIVNASGDLVPITPTPQPTDSFSPRPSSVRETRSTERRIKKRRLQDRSEIAAEQMVEVVKAADTGEHLTVLFRDLASGETDADKGRKTSMRRKRRILEESHCSMLVDAIFEILLSMEEKRSNRQGATAKDVVAVMRTIGVFTSISPMDVHRHLDMLLPYLKADNGMTFQQEAVVVTSLCNAVAKVAPVMSKHELDELGTTSLGDDLVKITYKFGREALSAAICALCALAHHKESHEHSPFKAKILNLARTFYSYLLKHRNEDDLGSMTNKAKANIQRALSVLGAVCRYHESFADDKELGIDSPKALDVAPDHLTFKNLTSVFEKLFTVFLSKNDAQTKCAALRGLCGVFISRPREMLRMDQTGLITEVMDPDAPTSLQLEALVCWRDILLTEESRIESGEAKKKMDSKTNITVSKKISGDQDADATLFGGVLTSHASRLLEMTQASDTKLRFAALDLVGHLLRQGQINPNETVPFLLALQGDVEEDGIRALALKLLMIEGEKRPDMLRQRVYAGIKQAYLFQTSVYPTRDNVSALVRIRSGGTIHTECVFGRVFKECIANIRKQRRGLFSSLLRRFDLQNWKKAIETNGKSTNRTAEEKFLRDLPLLSFTAQVLAYLPYKVASDPLFIIYSITSALALRGPDLLDRLANFLRPYGLSSEDALDDTIFEEDALELAAQAKVPHDANEASILLQPDFDAKTFSSLCAEAAAQALLLRLKSFLRHAYDFSESRIFGFNPDSKDDKEKPISKAALMTFDAQIPMLLAGGGGDMTDIDCMINQYSEFRRLMRMEATAESSAMDDDDDDADDDDDDVGPRKKKPRRSVASNGADIDIDIDDEVMSP